MDNFSLDDNLHQQTLFIVDEASMIANDGLSGAAFGTGRLLDDLIQYVYAGTGCRLMLIGDTAQLPPVGEEQSPALSPDVLKGYGLEVYEAQLTEVVRQMHDSGILWNATELRASCEVVICTPYTDLVTAVAKTKGTNIHVGAENVHFEKSGAFTGEISADMLVDLGVEYVIVGHSERRQYFAETDQTVNKRALAALNAGLKVIICVGESLQQREEGVTEELVRMQTKIALRDVTAEQMANVVIAYEPIWAIGTGKTATADQAQEVCAAIRKVVGELYGEDAAKALTVQYGGSMNAKNCEELLSKKDVDGGLIGGASLKAPDFAVIVNAATKG